MGDSRPIWFWLSNPWAPAVLGGVILAWAVWKMNWRVALIAVAAVGLADPLCSRVIKPMFGRARPCQVEQGVHLVAPVGVDGCGSGASMPSTHSANTAALAVSLASPPLAGVAVLVGTSRVVVGQHYPSDVLAGWAIGGVVGAAVRAAARRVFGWT